MSDTQRYCQTGNAVTVNVIQYIFMCLKSHLISSRKRYQRSNSCSRDVTLRFPPKRKKRRTNQVTNQPYVAYFKRPKQVSEHGLTVSSQKAIIDFHAKSGKWKYQKMFIEQPNEFHQLTNAIEYCKKHQSLLVIATINTLERNIELLLDVKKQLGKHFKSCDVPSNDYLSFQVFMNGVLKAREINSIVIKHGLAVRKAAGKSIGTPKNLTSAGRAK